jgi:hypothetical protein
MRLRARLVQVLGRFEFLTSGLQPKGHPTFYPMPLPCDLHHVIPAGGGSRDFSLGPVLGQQLPLGSGFLPHHNRTVALVTVTLLPLPPLPAAAASPTI